MILTARERAWLASRPPQRQNDLALTVFCAKEAFYKCQYPVTGAFLEFSDVEVDIEVDVEASAGTFEAWVLDRVATETARLRGQILYEGGRVACGVTLLV
jgi:4'-phosphopantetheinyl transferase EntD